MNKAAPTSKAPLTKATVVGWFRGLSAHERAAALCTHNTHGEVTALRDMYKERNKRRVPGVFIDISPPHEGASHVPNGQEVRFKDGFFFRPLPPLLQNTTTTKRSNAERRLEEELRLCDTEGYLDTLTVSLHWLSTPNGVSEFLSVMNCVTSGRFLERPCHTFFNKTRWQWTDPKWFQDGGFFTVAMFAASRLEQTLWRSYFAWSLRDPRKPDEMRKWQPSKQECTVALRSSASKALDPLRTGLTAFWESLDMNERRKLIQLSTPAIIAKELRDASSSRDRRKRQGKSGRERVQEDWARAEGNLRCLTSLLGTDLAQSREGCGYGAVLGGPLLVQNLFLSPLHRAGVFLDHVLRRVGHHLLCRQSESIATHLILAEEKAKAKSKKKAKKRNKPRTPSLSNPPSPSLSPSPASLPLPSPPPPAFHPLSPPSVSSLPLSSASLSSMSSPHEEPAHQHAGDVLRVPRPARSNSDGHRLSAHGKRKKKGRFKGGSEGEEEAEDPEHQHAGEGGWVRLQGGGKPAKPPRRISTQPKDPEADKGRDEESAEAAKGDESKPRGKKKKRAKRARGKSEGDLKPAGSKLEPAPGLAAPKERRASTPAIPKPAAMLAAMPWLKDEAIGADRSKVQPRSPTPLLPVDQQGKDAAPAHASQPQPQPQQPQPQPQSVSRVGEAKGKERASNVHMPPLFSHEIHPRNMSLTARALTPHDHHAHRASRSMHPRSPFPSTSLHHSRGPSMLSRSASGSSSSSPSLRGLHAPVVDPARVQDQVYSLSLLSSRQAKRSSAGQHAMPLSPPFSSLPPSSLAALSGPAAPPAMPSLHWRHSWHHESPLNLRSFSTPPSSGPRFPSSPRSWHAPNTDLPPPLGIPLPSLPSGMQQDTLAFKRALFMTRLHTDIVHFLNIVKQPAWQQKQRLSIAADIENVVQSLWPMCLVDVVGSVATGLALPDSDVDVVVVNVPTPLFVRDANGPTQRISPTSMRALAQVLSGQAWCHSVVPLPNAASPVIKLTVDNSVASNASVCSTTSAESVELPPTVPVDVSFACEGTIHSGLLSRQFVVQKWHQHHPELEALLLVLKKYLRVRKLNDAYTGGLSSFSLTLLVVYFLEQLSEICPQISVPRAPPQPPAHQWWPPGVPQPAHELFGELLWQFLAYFGRRFDFTATQIRVQGVPGLVMAEAPPVPEEVPKCFPVWIDNPLMPGTNVAASSFAMWRVQQAFCEAHEMLASLLSAERGQQQRWILQHLFDPQSWERAKSSPGQFSHNQEGDSGSEGAQNAGTPSILKRSRSQDQVQRAQAGKSKLNKFEEV